MPKKTLNLSDKDIENLKLLRTHFNAMSDSEAVRRSISQSSRICKLSGSDDTVSIYADDGKIIKL